MIEHVQTSFDGRENDCSMGAELYASRIKVDHGFQNGLWAHDGATICPVLGMQRPKWKVQRACEMGSSVSGRLHDSKHKE